MDPRICEQLEIVCPGPINDSVLTQQRDHRSTDIWNGEDLGPLDCRGCSKEMEKILLLDNQVIDIIKLVGLEGLYRAPSREIDHGLISALVERWRPKTHTFHLPCGEMSITLQDVEVILGLPIDGEVLVGPTGGGAGALCVKSCLVLKFCKLTRKFWWGKEFSSAGYLSTLQSHCRTMQRKFKYISTPGAIF